MATILKGAPVVAAMNERNAALCEQLKAKGITPTLAVVRVGEREDDLSYERGVIARCGKVLTRTSRSWKWKKLPSMDSVRVTLRYGTILIMIK